MPRSVSPGSTPCAVRAGNHPQAAVLLGGVVEIELHRHQPVDVRALEGEVRAVLVPRERRPAGALEVQLVGEQRERAPRRTARARRRTGAGRRRARSSAGSRCRNGSIERTSRAAPRPTPTSRTRRAGPGSACRRPARPAPRPGARDSRRTRACTRSTAARRRSSSAAGKDALAHEVAVRRERRRARRAWRRASRRGSLTAGSGAVKRRPGGAELDRRHGRRGLHRQQPGARAERARARRPAARRRSDRTATSSPNLVDCDFADYIDKEAFLARVASGDAARADRGDPAPGRVLRHHRVERARHARRQLRGVEDAVHVRHERAASRSSTPRRRRCTAWARSSARTRRASGRSTCTAGRSCSSTAGCGTRCARAAQPGRGPALLQRVRPARVHTRATWRASPGSTTCSSARATWCACSRARDGFADGEQRRDFVYVGDVVAREPLVPRPPRGLGHLQRRHAAARRASTTWRAPCIAPPRPRPDRVRAVPGRAARQLPEPHLREPRASCASAGCDTPFLTVEGACRGT